MKTLSTVLTDLSAKQFKQGLRGKTPLSKYEQEAQLEIESMVSSEVSRLLVHYSKMLIEKGYLTDKFNGENMSNIIKEIQIRTEN